MRLSLKFKAEKKDYDEITLKINFKINVEKLNFVSPLKEGHMVVKPRFYFISENYFPKIKNSFAKFGSLFGFVK